MAITVGDDRSDTTYTSYSELTRTARSTKHKLVLMGVPNQTAIPQTSLVLHLHV